MPRSVLRDGLRAADLSRDRLRDIEACLATQGKRLYHLGFRSPVARNTLANANATRPWQIYADLAQHLIGIARPLYAERADRCRTATRRSTPSTRRPSTCVCRSTRGRRSGRPRPAIKLHTLLDLRGSIPAFIHISDGKTHEVNVLDALTPEPGAFYLSRPRLSGLRSAARLPRGRQLLSSSAPSAGLRFKRRYSHPVDRRNTGASSAIRPVVLEVLLLQAGLSRPRCAASWSGTSPANASLS